MAGVERPFLAAPIASAGGRVIAAPFQFYTTGEDRLRVVSVNALVGVALKIHSRAVDSAGKIQANADDHVPLTTRTAKTTEHALGVGALLNLTVFASSGSPQFGQTFVIVQLIRGTGAAAIVLGTLLAGYVTSTQHLAWPGSPIQNSIDGPGYARGIVGTIPGAGNEIFETVPTGARWRLYSLFAQYTASAVAGDRISSLLVIANGAVVGRFHQVTHLVATGSWNLTWAGGIVVSQPAGVAWQTTPTPAPIELRAGDVIQTSTLNLDPGDQYTLVQYTVDERLEVL